MDLSKIPVPLLKLIGFRGVQLAVLVYLTARYGYALADHDFRTALTGSQTQAVIMGYDIPYEVITALTPAIVVWAEFLARGFGRTDAPVLRRFGPKAGTILSAVVCVLSSAYFWVRYYAATRNPFSDGVRPTPDMAFTFMMASVVALYLVCSTKVLKKP